jgi:hypothetical protein
MFGEVAAHFSAAVRRVGWTGKGERDAQSAQFEQGDPDADLRALFAEMPGGVRNTLAVSTGGRREER